MSWCNWCDVGSCPSTPWNREVVDWIIEDLVKVMPSETTSDIRAIWKAASKKLKEQNLWIKPCALCIKVENFVEKVKVDQFVEKVKVDAISITLL